MPSSRRVFVTLLPLPPLLLVLLMSSGCQSRRPSSGAARSEAIAVTPGYTLRDLGTLGGKTSSPVSINQSGVVVGCSTNIHGDRCVFLADDNGMRPLPLPSDGVSQVMGINARGEVVGQCRIGGGGWHAFRYADGKTTPVGTFGGTFSIASALTDAGLVAGAAMTAGNRNWRAFRSRGGTIRDLGTLGGHQSQAFAINRRGDVVGQAETHREWNRHAFLYRDGVMRDLGTLGGSDSQALGINDAGAIVGWAHDAADTERAFLCRDGRMEDLGTPPGTISRALGINNSGHVVGSFHTERSPKHAFLYRDGKVHDLNNLVRPGTRWELTEACALNEAGQIAAIGYRARESHALLLTPLARGQRFSDAGAAPNADDR